MLVHEKAAQYYAVFRIFPRLRRGEFVHETNYRYKEDFLHRVAIWNRLIHVVDITGLVPASRPMEFRNAPESWDPFGFSSALDHRSYWVTATGDQIIWCEPYVDHIGRSVERTIAAIRSIGWYGKEINGDFSVWNPEAGTIPVFGARDQVVVDELEEILTNNLTAKGRIWTSS